MISVRAGICCKSLFGRRTKIPRAANAFRTRRREGPYRFIQNQSPASVVPPTSDAAAERPRDRLWRDFLGRSIFDFCSNIYTKPTCRRGRLMSLAGITKEVASRGSAGQLLTRAVWKRFAYPNNCSSRARRTSKWPAEPIFAASGLESIRVQPRAALSDLNGHTARTTVHALHVRIAARSGLIPRRFITRVRL